jgi:hypothetical protein
MLPLKTGGVLAPQLTREKKAHPSHRAQECADLEGPATASTARRGPTAKRASGEQERQGEYMYSPERRRETMEEL